MDVPFYRAHPTAARRAGLALILLVAFVLRVWNLNWDEGTHQHPDERYWSIVTGDISAPGGVGDYFDSANSSLNPYNHRDTWVYGTFPLFTTKATASFLHDGPFPAGAIVTTADAVGIDLRTDGIDDFDAQYNANLIGRLLSAVVDTGTVLMVYLLGRDLFDRRVGFVAATLLAFTPLHIQYAHFFGAEPWVTFFVTTGIWMSLKLARGDLRSRIALGTGALMGLAVASKLIALAALVVPALAVLIATAPAIATAAQDLTASTRRWITANSSNALLYGLGAFLLLIGAAIMIPGFVSTTTVAVVAVLGAGAVSAYSLFVIRPKEARAVEPRVLYDQTQDPPEVVVDPPGGPTRERSALDIVIWGAFTGVTILAATFAVYRIFQPYTFDGFVSIDPRFTQDLDYLEGVNSGGNVPWVVQWIGRTPLLFPLWSAFMWGLGPALGIAVVFGVARSVRDVVRNRTWILLLPLAYLAIMLGLVSQQFNPLIRYLLPAYPVAVLLGAFGVMGLWDSGRRVLADQRRAARTRSRAMAGAAIGLVAITAFWGLAFVNGVYNQTHPRVEASVWMAENLPPGAVLSAQVWDDSLPLPVSGTEGWAFTQVSLDPFQPDRAEQKTEQLIAGLDQVDYVVEASNRLYDSIPRIPARYPATTAYYEALFDGSLGFQQVAQFRNSPSLFGLDIPDHFAEETFTVYDHPTVTIWEKTDQWSPERAAALLNPDQATVAPDVIPKDAASNALQLRPEDNALAETGATFNETFSSDGAVASVPWLFWLVWLQVAAFAVLPWTTMLFSRLPDQGYGLSKGIGFLTTGLIVWIAVAWGPATYSNTLIWLVFAGVALVGLVLWARHSSRMTAMFDKGRSAWLAAEAVFLAVFALALWMRSANPDLWEAFLGGEKPMELAYLTAIGRSDTLPAVDPWFAGGFMNYYYLGWFLLSVPMRALKVVPEVAFNLGVATYAAITAAAAFSIVHNLVAVSRRRWRSASDPSDSRIPVWSGLIGVLLLIGIGNLDAIRLHYARLEAVNTWTWGNDIPVVNHIVTFLGGSWAWVTGSELGRFDWWAPSRVNEGNFDITEFPYFTFLFGDLHPHMMGMVFVGLTVALAFAYLLAARAGDWKQRSLLAASLGLMTGVVRAVNTWDLPSTLIVAGVAIVVGGLLSPAGSGPANPDRSRNLVLVVGTVAIAAGLSNWGGPGAAALLALIVVGLVLVVSAAASSATRVRVVNGVTDLGLLAAVHLIVFWPYLENSDPIDTGLESAVAGSPLDDFAIHWGIFLVIATAMALALATDMHRRSKLGEPTRGPLPARMWNGPLRKGVWLGLAIAVVLVTGFVSTGAAAVSVAGVLVFGFFFLTEVRRPDTDFGRLMATGLFTLGFAIAGGVDVVTVQNDIQRMNTVFKFWLQSWQYFALAGGFAVWQVGKVLAERPVAVSAPGRPTKFELQPARPWRANIWALTVVVLLLAGLAYPLLGTRTRLETRFAQLPATLDGLAYLDADPVIRRENPDGSGEDITVQLADDVPLIEWLRENVRGTPGLVEWSGGGYDWNARMAIHTGIPTVLGWDWHQKQQRWSYQFMVDERQRAVQDFYRETDPERISDFLRTYDVSYVIVGTQEHRFGSARSITALALHPALEPVFISGRNIIYRVDRTELWPGANLGDIDVIALGAD